MCEFTRFESVGADGEDKGPRAGGGKRVARFRRACLPAGQGQARLARWLKRLFMRKPWHGVGEQARAWCGGGPGEQGRTCGTERPMPQRRGQGGYRGSRGIRGNGGAAALKPGLPAAVRPGTIFRRTRNRNCGKSALAGISQVRAARLIRCVVALRLADSGCNSRFLTVSRGKAKKRATPFGMTGLAVAPRTR